MDPALRAYLKQMFRRQAQVHADVIQRQAEIHSNAIQHLAEIHAAQIDVLRKELAALKKRKLSRHRVGAAVMVRSKQNGKGSDEKSESLPRYNADQPPNYVI